MMNGLTCELIRGTVILSSAIIHEVKGEQSIFYENFELI